MRILLTTLNSKYVHSNLALKCLYAAGLESGADIHVKEFTINNEEGYIFNEILMGAYDMVCFSCYIWNVEKTLSLCENLKKAAPGLKVALGGPEVSFDTLEVVKENKSVDFVMVGEGEAVFNGLCKVFQEESLSYERIRGLVYRSNGKIYVNPEGGCMDFETIPFPYNYFSCETDKVIYYESARGCPYNCSYCMSSLDKKLRALSVQRVKMDLGYFIRKKVKQVKFLDRTFNWDKDRSSEIIKYLIHMDNGETNFHFELCGELIDQRFLDLIKTARKGLFQFEIGLQTTNRQVLRAVNRSDRVDLLCANVKALTDMGTAHIHVDLIAGLPFEEYGSFRNSFNDAYALKADTLQLGFLKLLKGTEIREKASLYGYVYRKKPPYEVISNNFLSTNDVLGLKRIEAVLELYYNKGGFRRILELLAERGTCAPFDFYEELATFYYLKGYQHQSHKKEDLYRILYQYAMWRGKGIQDFTQEALNMLESDMEETLNFDAVKKFKRKGWDIP